MTVVKGHHIYFGVVWAPTALHTHTDTDTFLDLLTNSVSLL